MWDMLCGELSLSREGINPVKNKILIIDDDIELCCLLKQCLGNEGFEVVYIHEGSQAVSFIESDHVNLVILDVMLPKIDGFTVLRQIRQVTNIPVLMLSAKSEEMNKVLGLKTGADDYLTKPFGLSELVARVENLLRRYAYSNQSENKNAMLTFDTIKIDKDKCVVTVSNKIVQLTSKEYKLLCFLAENPQKVFTKKQIYNNVWEEEFMYDDNTIMALISRLRKKVENNPDDPKYIQTVWGIGYRFTCEDK